MKRNARIVLYSTIVLGAIACAEEPLESRPDRTAELQIVGTALKQYPDGEQNAEAKTRATEVNKTFTFANGDALSLFMRGTTYTAVDNRKVTYSKPDAAAGTWSIAGKPILLNDRTAIVSMVYPYADANAFGNIPFTTGAYTPAKDLLWKQQDVYAAAHEAKVEQMKHALTRVKFILKRDDRNATDIPDRFIGTGSVTKVAINNGTAAGSGTAAAVFSHGSLNLGFTAPASPVAGTTAGEVADAATFTLSTTGHTTDLLTLPIAALKQNLVALNVTVDGIPLTTSLPYATPSPALWEAGKCYTYTATVKSRGIEISSCTIEDWTTGKEGNNDLEVPTPAASKTSHNDNNNK